MHTEETIVFFQLKSVKILEKQRKIEDCKDNGTAQTVQLVGLSGLGIPQAVSCRLLTVEVRVHIQDNPCNICDGERDTGNVHYPSPSVWIYYMQYTTNSKSAAHSSYY